MIWSWEVALFRCHCGLAQPEAPPEGTPAVWGLPAALHVSGRGGVLLGDSPAVGAGWLWPV